MVLNTRRLNLYSRRRASINNLQNNWQGVFQSNSWVTNDPVDPYDMDGRYSAESQENDQAVFDTGVTMVYAVGNSNEGVQARSISRDSAAKNVISVGGVDHGNDQIDGNDQWINRGQGATPSQGPAEDGRFKPDLCGPFDDGYVADSADSDGEDGYRNGNYVTWLPPPDIEFSGTSFATPVVAGSAGLVYQMYRANHFGNNPGGFDPSPSTVKALLIANARQINFIGTPGLNAADGDGRFQQGWGFVDVGEVFDVGDDHFIVDDDAPLRVLPPPVVNQHGYDIFVQNDHELKVSLVWTDPPNAPGANPALVNHLDLEAIDPNGNSFRGNVGLANARWSNTGGAWDTINNVENIFIETPVEGRWRVRVHATQLNADGHIATPERDQTYSLIASYHPAKVIPLFEGFNLNIGTFSI